MPLDEIVGRNLRARREALGLTGEEVARRARDWGLTDWTRSTLDAVERGKRSLSIGETIGLFGALDLEPADLFDGEEWIVYGPQGKVRASAVAAIFSGRSGEVQLSVDYWNPGQMDAHIAVMERIFEATPDHYDTWCPGATEEDLERAKTASRGEPETKLARALDLDPLHLSLMARYLWEGRSLTEERDRRLAGQLKGGATPRQAQAIRGHITRDLKQELKDARARMETGEYERGPDFRWPEYDDEALKRAANALFSAIVPAGEQQEAPEQEAARPKRSKGKAV